MADVLLPKIMFRCDDFRIGVVGSTAPGVVVYQLGWQWWQASSYCYCVFCHPPPPVVEKAPPLYLLHSVYIDDISSGITF